MGKISFAKGELISEIAERVGYKSGLSFSFKRMVNFVIDENEKKTLIDNTTGGMHIRAEEYEALYYSVLEGTGYIPRGQGEPVTFKIHFYLQKMQQLGLENEAGKVLEEYLKFMKDEIEKAKIGNVNTYNPMPFIEKCMRELGTIGMKIAIDIIEIMIQNQNISPWYLHVRRIEWKDTIELEELFKSESLKTCYGSFIDQRYIDYLGNNLDDIGEINWRKFEGLTGEFFKKNGYEVCLGKGRKDGGIDVRVWKNKEDKENPPLILIQCKRYKGKVKEETVKALWTDVVDEKATSGLIVTSSEVAKGAKIWSRARGHHIGFAERDTLIKWIESMKSIKNEIIV